MNSKFCAACEGTEMLSDILTEESRNIRKKLLAITDISLPENGFTHWHWMCRSCLDNLENAYTFKIQCEFMDRKYKLQINPQEIEEQQPSDHSTLSTTTIERYFEVANLLPIVLDTFNCVEEEIEEKQAKDLITGDSSLECSFCDKYFETQKQLAVHMVLHEGIRNYACQSCDKLFANPTNLQRHVQTVHQNLDREFACDICGQKFHQLASMNTHKATHLKDRMFECVVCGKAFKLKHHLSNHLESIHNLDGIAVKKILQLICGKCGKPCETVKSLSVHIKTHFHKRGKNEQVDWLENAV